jgi:hypothetical protein
MSRQAIANDFWGAISQSARLLSVGMAGVFWWIGLCFSLAFLALAPIVVGAVAIQGSTWRSGIRLFLLHGGAFALGALVPTIWVWRELQLFLPSVWGLNLENHAGFYQHMPRSYWPWTLVNLIDLAVAIGPGVLTLSLATWIIRSSRRRRGALWRLDLVYWGTILLLDASGRNLSEVARLWLFLTPFACIGAGRLLDSIPLGRAFRVVIWGFQGTCALVVASGVEPLLPIGLSGGG